MADPGTTLGPYRVLRSLGEGGMAEVFLVEAGSGAPFPEGTRMALKLLRPALTENAEVVARFRREAEAGSRIRHRCVVATLGTGTIGTDAGERQFLLMESVEGGTLRGLLEAEERLPEPRVVAVAAALAAALEAVHDAGLVHRDVKPENVLLASDGRIALSDLGLSRVREEELRLTRTGQFVGSLFYASPEQIRGARGVDARSDLYSLGVLLFECLTGQNPFAHEELGVVLRRHLEDRPPRAGFLVPEVSVLLEEVLDVLLLKQPGDRLPSAAELRAILAAGEAGAWWRARRAARTEEAIRMAARRIRSASAILDAVAPARAPVSAPPTAAGGEATEREHSDGARALGRLVGSSERMQTVRKKLLAFAGFRARHVLFSGETGTGKSLCARALHEMTFGAAAPLVIVDGRVTDADGLEDAARRGRGGSLLVDGVEDLHAAIQGRLLALVAREEGGAPARIMAATSLRPTEEDLGARLRADLFYRLRGLALPLPPLRERPDDLLALATHFLRRAPGARERGLTLDPAIEIPLRARRWPGNVRQLRDLVESAVLDAGPDVHVLGEAHLE